MSIGGGYLLWHLFLRQHAHGQSDPFSNQVILNAFSVTFFYFVFMLGTLLFGITAVTRTVYYFFRMLFFIGTGRNLRELAPDDAASLGIFAVLGTFSLLLASSAMHFALQNWTFTTWSLLSLVVAFLPMVLAITCAFTIRDILKHGYRHDRKPKNLP